MSPGIKVGVVIPVGPGRRENLIQVLRSLEYQDLKPDQVVLICDGDEALVLSSEAEQNCPSIPLVSVLAPKHKPGLEQPRNMGVRFLRHLAPQVTHVWFCDSDVILDRKAGEAFGEAMAFDAERILIGPYEWLPPGVREPVQRLRNDPRWESFVAHDPDETVVNDLSAGLACFSGNLIWPISEFERVGGFWNEINHGRCEDGELGLRAVAMGVPIGFVRDARGWHLEHDRNIEWIEQTNMRDVPMLNARHPWVQGEGLFVVEEDGKRFNCRCGICGDEMNTAEIWAHQATHQRLASVPDPR